MGQENSGHVPSANAKRLSPEEVKQLLMENGRELSDDERERVLSIIDSIAKERA